MSVPTEKEPGTGEEGAPRGNALGHGGPDPASLAYRVAGPESRELQAALFARCFKKGVSASDLAWRYDENPHGKAFSLMLVEPGGRPACSFAYSPRRMLSFGRAESEGLGGQQGDVMTDPDWRKRGLARRVAERAESETRRLGWAMNWGFPNRQSAPVFTKLGWETVGVIRPWTLYLGLERRTLAERQKEGRLAAALLPLDLVGRCLPGRRANRRAAGGSPYWRLLGAFPAEVEALARKVEPRFALMVRRDKAYLDWRFLRTPSGRHRALGLYSDEGRFRGYAVVQLPHAGDGLGWLVDLLAEDEAAVAGAVEAAIACLAFAGAWMVRASAVDGSWWEGVLRGAGFLPPKKANHLWVYRRVLDPAHALTGPAADASRWYLTDGDRDDETVG